MLQERKEFESLIHAIIGEHLATEAKQWLEEKAMLVREEKTASNLNLSFVTVPRKTGRQPVHITTDQQREIAEQIDGFSINGWPVDKLSRLWLLMQVNDSEKSIYINKIENLFKAAEMNELVALYASLPSFAYPEEWQLRCAEGIRSNIGNVLEAIMYHNPYPAKHLPEKAWNQLVLKAFFTDKNINSIIGVDERANKELASILIDYAHERWAARRTVNPHLWRLVSKFIDDTNFADIEKVFKIGDGTEKKAAALACYYSNFQPARQLLEQETGLTKDIEENKLSWTNI